MRAAKTKKGWNDETARVRNETRFGSESEHGNKTRDGNGKVDNNATTRCDGRRQDKYIVK